MKTEQPEMDALLTVKSPNFNEQYFGEDEFFPDQQLCNQESNSSLKQEELEPLQIKEEQQEEFWTKQEVEQFIQNQGIDVCVVTPSNEENELREPKPDSEQLLCLASAVTKNQDEEGSQRVDSGSAEGEELKPKKRRLKTRIHHADFLPRPDSLEQTDFKEEEERNFDLDQDEEDTPQVKEEGAEEIILEQKHFELTYGDNDNSEMESNGVKLFSDNFLDTLIQDSVGNYPKSLNQCIDNCEDSAECAVNENGFKNKFPLSHTDERPFTCNICEKQFQYLSYFKQHMRMHTGEKPYSCELCGKRFTKSGTLTVHMRIHTGDKPFFCETCGKHFTLRSGLAQHMRIHTGDKPYFCEICRKSFTHSSSFSAHMRFHSGEKPFFCEICGKHFTHGGSLSTHMRIHTGDKPYFCEICGKHFTYSSSLTAHMRIHTGDMKYSCEICGKHFNLSTNLNVHMRIHTGDKPYPCETCGKRFRSSSHLTRHMRIHTGDKPYICGICGECFNQSTTLNNHMRIHSGNKP
ncbi:uncharacterized protein KZ484_026738 isoform 2-T2 [Pholidichthys leucotaenia]